MIFLTGTVALADWWVDQSVAAARLGGSPIAGPFPSREAAENYKAGSHISSMRVFERPSVAQPAQEDSQTSADNSAAEQQQRERVEEEARAKKAEAERRRQEQEDRERQIKFEHDKQEAFHSLKGGVASGSGLKSIPALKDQSSGSFGLKRLGDTGIKDLRPDHELRDLGGDNAAWKQLNAAAWLAQNSIQAYDQHDPTKAVYLADQAIRAANGEPLGVAVPAAPPFPRRPSPKPVPPEYQEVQKIIQTRMILSATALSKRMSESAKLAQAKERAEADVKAAQSKLEILQSTPPQLDPVSPPAHQAASATLKQPPPATVDKASALAEARAALEAAQKANANAARAHESADAEMKASQSKLNEVLQAETDLEANPDLAATMQRKLLAGSSN